MTLPQPREEPEPASDLSERLAQKNYRVRQEGSWKNTQVCGDQGPGNCSPRLSQLQSVS